MSQRWTVGVAGHVDHGKTSLVKALTGVDTDRKPEEKARGLSIEAGVAELTLPSGRTAALVDIPGHTDYLKNAIRGLSGVDAAILVVAADDGVMPQTREHLDILSFFKASGGIVVMSKTDQVDDETLEIGELETMSLLEGGFMEDAPILRFSAVRQTGKARILRALDRLAPTDANRSSKEPFRMWIDQVRGFPGVGTVVSGTVSSGRIRRDSPVELLPSAVRSRVRSMESHGRAVHEASTGQRVGVNLPKIPLDAVCRGMVLSEPDVLKPSHFLNAEMRIPATVFRPIKNRQKVKLHIGASVTAAAAVLMDAEKLGADESGLVQFRTVKPVPARPRDPFVVTLMNIPTVIAGGVILEVPHAKFRPVKARRIISYLTALRHNDPDGFVERFFAHEPHRFLTARELSRAVGFPITRLEAAINSRVSRGDFVYFKGKGAVVKNEYLRIKNKIFTVISQKIEADPVRKHIVPSEISTVITDKVDEDLIVIAAEELLSEKRVVKIGGGYHLPDALGRFSPQRREISAVIDKFSEKAGVAPFSPDTVWKKHARGVDKKDVQRILNFMCTEKKLVRLGDNRFLSPGALEEIKTRVKKAIAEKGCITLKDSAEILGYGRWGGAPVFDYLDKIGFTTRIGNERTLRQR